MEAAASYAPNFDVINKKLAADLTGLSEYEMYRFGLKIRVDQNCLRGKLYGNYPGVIVYDCVNRI